MLCNAIIQPHFDYVCSAWYPSLNEKLKKKIEIAQNKCINAITFNFVNNSCSHCVNKVYEYAPQCGIESRSNFAKLNVPFRKTNMGQKGLSHIGPSLWNNLSGYMRKTPF